MRLQAIVHTHLGCRLLLKVQTLLCQSICSHHTCYLLALQQGSMLEWVHHHLHLRLLLGDT